MDPSMKGYPRSNGTFGIRDYTLVLPTSGCMAETARKLADRIGANYIWHPHGCDLLESDAAYYTKQIEAICSHPNVSRLVVVTMNCAPIPMSAIEGASFGKELYFLNYHQFGNEKDLIEEGSKLPKRYAYSIPMDDTITVGVKCGGSTKRVIEEVNPIMGAYCDALIDSGGTVIIGENWEFLGAIEPLCERSATDHAENQIRKMADKLRSEFELRYGIDSPTYTVDFSLGRFRKAGTKPIQGVLQVTEKPTRPGLWILDGPNADMGGLSALAMSGCHAILFSTGIGLPIGNALCPVAKWGPDHKETIEDCLAERDRHFEWQFHLRNMTW